MINELWPLVVEQHSVVSLIEIDLDGFKDVNDTYGHLAGDQVLRITASILKERFRSNDIVVRYGGDEFVVLMTHTSTEHARMAAERIRTAIHNTSFDMKSNRISTTVSVGIASFPDGVTDATEVLDKADIALYKSKQCGRDRVTYYDSDLETVPAYA